VVGYCRWAGAARQHAVSPEVITCALALPLSTPPLPLSSWRRRPRQCPWPEWQSPCCQSRGPAHRYFGGMARLEDSRGALIRSLHLCELKPLLVCTLHAFTADTAEGDAHDLTQDDAPHTTPVTANTDDAAPCVEGAANPSTNNTQAAAKASAQPTGIAAATKPGDSWCNMCTFSVHELTL